MCTLCQTKPFVVPAVILCNFVSDSPLQPQTSHNPGEEPLPLILRLGRTSYIFISRPKGR
ncbi:hypothetical protein SPRA44_330077 [Serratia proteamaculans]|nr:hypothetical protein SPRA44_330077 [Serratia proteamaculans]